MPIDAPQLRIEQDATNVQVSKPAPIGGWNTRDNIGAMPVEDAITLDNFFPDTIGIKNRNGFTDWGVTGITGQIESLWEYRKTTSKTGLAAAGGKVFTWDVTASAQAATEIGTGFTNDRWQFLNVKQFSLMCNGADAPQVYNGSTLAAISFSGDISTKGEEAMDGLIQHKSRVYFWDQDDSAFWYGGVDAVAGAFTEFPLETLMSGNVFAVTTVSQDTGAGLDDLLAIISNQGEVLLYSGSNPGDANDWSLVQRYQIPRPINIRAVTRFAGDAYILVENDFIPLLQYVAQAQPFPSKLSGAVADAVGDYEGNFGWQALLYGRGKWLFINVPVVSNTTAHQYVINSVTGAACRFTGMNGNTFAVANNRLFFGGNGKIFRADDGLNDNTADISLTVQDAFTTIGTDQRKRFTLAQQLIKSLGDITIAHALAFDYGDVLTPQTTTSTATGTPWDDSLWDVVDWSSESATRLQNFAVAGTGLSVSTKMDIDINDVSLEWYRSVYKFDILQT